MIHHICDACGKEVNSSSSLYYLAAKDLEHGSESRSTKEKALFCKKCIDEIFDTFFTKSKDALAPVVAR